MKPETSIPDNQIYEIFDYYYLPFQQTIWFKLLIIFGLLLLGALIGFLYFRRRHRKKLPAWLWALEEISNLAQAPYSNKKELKKLYFDLTEIIKRYFDKRFKWHTQDLTDTELITFLETKDFDVILLEHLKNMLQGAEWVKFANQDMIKTQVIADLKLASVIVEKTKPLEDESKKKAS